MVNGDGVVCLAREPFRRIRVINQFPQRFGKYLLLERLSCGGMAEVFRVKAFGVEGFQKTFALKRILPHISEDPEFITMFIDEAKIASRLQHGNICQIYEFGRVGDFYFQLMEYIAGFDLRRLSEEFQKRGQHLPIGFILYLVARACEGLDYAHRKADSRGNPLNIVHRDVSPQNIMVSYEGTVKLIDFGIAKAKSRASQTQAGVIKGKFAYMCPELLRGESIDGRADIFAIGIVLFELLTGQSLFDRETDLDTLRAVMAADVPLPSSLNPEIPPAVDKVLLKALAANVNERYQAAEELTEALDLCVMQTGQPMSSNRVRRFMTEHFAAEVAAERDKVLHFAAFSETGEMVVAPGEGGAEARPRPKTVETFSGRRLKQRPAQQDDPWKEEVTYVHGKSETGEKDLDGWEEDPGQDLLRQPEIAWGPESVVAELDADDLEELDADDLREVDQLEGMLGGRDVWAEANAPTHNIDDLVVEPVGFDWDDNEVTGAIDPKAPGALDDDIFEPKLLDEAPYEPALVDEDAYERLQEAPFEPALMDDDDGHAPLFESEQATAYLGADDDGPGPLVPETAQGGAGTAAPDAGAYQDPGRDAFGFDANGFDANGFDANGFDANGFDANGFDGYGYDAYGYDAYGYDGYGYDAQGYSANGFDSEGYDAQGNYDPGQVYDPERGYAPEHLQDGQAYDPQQPQDGQAYDGQAYDPQQPYDDQAYGAPGADAPVAHGAQGQAEGAYDDGTYDPQAFDDRTARADSYQDEPAGYAEGAYDEPAGYAEGAYDEPAGYAEAPEAPQAQELRGHALSGGYVTAGEDDLYDEDGEDPLHEPGEATVFDPEAGSLDELRRKYGLLPPGEEEAKPAPEGAEVMELDDDDLEVID